MFKFGKNKEVEAENVIQDSSKQEEVTASFVMAAKEAFKLLNSENVIITGQVKGTARVGAVVCLSNPGADDDEIIEVKIGAIETAPQKRVSEATDCDVTLYIENGKQYPLRKATVLFTKDCSAEEVRSAYINSLGDTYILKQKLEFSDEDLAQLSIVDCAEIWRMFIWFRMNVLKVQSEEEDQEYNSRMQRLVAALCGKIMEAEEIYCLFNKATGEPHMLSRTLKEEESYSCTPPDILIFAKAYEPAIKNNFSEEKFEVRKIEAGENKQGIYNFLGSIFYLNGAHGVQVLFEQNVIPAGMLVPMPDYDSVPEQHRPVTNPNLLRWMLLIGQMGEINGGDKELIYKLYCHFMSKEMVKAKFLIPMQSSGNAQQKGTGKADVKKAEALKFPTMAGKDGGRAVQIFTDWRRLRMMYGEKWNAMVYSIEDIIEEFDCAINVGPFPRAGGYISKDMFEQMKKTN